MGRYEALWSLVRALSRLTRLSGAIYIYSRPRNNSRPTRPLLPERKTAIKWRPGVRLGRHGVQNFPRSARSPPIGSRAAHMPYF